MARSTTTFTKSMKCRYPYHFTCNYCGQRNDKVADVTIQTSDTVQGTVYGK